MSHTYSSQDPWGQGEGQQPPPYGQTYGQQQPPGGPQYPPGPPQQGPPGGLPGYPPPGGQQPPQGGAWGQPEGQWGYGAYGAYDHPRRPGTVLGGAIMTYVGSAFLVLLGVVLLIGGAVSASFMEGAAESGAMGDMPPNTLRLVILGLGGFVLVLGAVLIALALFAQKGSNGARIGLTVIGGIQILLGLASLVTGSPQTIVTVLYVGVVLVLFWVGGANEWYRAQKAAR
ncbi:MAG: hypothetical protein GEV03_05945 [Streptosporangiales bacterium]|nr:hypothetical protein [Streptosporangiales bacterium]